MALALLIVTGCISFLHPRPQVKQFVNHLTQTPRVQGDSIVKREFVIQSFTYSFIAISIPTKEVA